MLLKPQLRMSSLPPLIINITSNQVDRSNTIKISGVLQNNNKKNVPVPRNFPCEQASAHQAPEQGTLSQQKDRKHVNSSLFPYEN